MIYIVIIDDNIAIRINKNDYNCNDEDTIVTWTNNNATLHTVVSGTADSGSSGVFESPIMAKGVTFQHTLILQDNYYCTLPPFMIAQVVVK
jgi:hypothetical protein